MFKSISINLKKGSVLIVYLLLVLFTFSACGEKKDDVKDKVQESSAEQSTSDASYSYEVYPLERNGVELHLDCVKEEGKEPDKDILLIHGLTYSSHEFDVNYEDYSLVRKLAREGYAVWRLDIAGYGQSDPVQDGFMPDSDYAAEDINAAVELIVNETGKDKIDLLGWSWGTVTSSRFVAKHSEHINKLVLYAPILSGVGEADVKDAFHHNYWEDAAADFCKNDNGEFDEDITDPIVVNLFCSGCWRYDGDSSPNGGRKDLSVARSEKLIDLKQIKTPTLVICGDADPYLNYELVNSSLDDLPEGSKLEVIKGGSHIVFIEKPYYHDFQNRLLDFLD